MGVISSATYSIFPQLRSDATIQRHSSIDSNRPVLNNCSTQSSWHNASTDAEYIPPAKSQMNQTKPHTEKNITEESLKISIQRLGTQIAELRAMYNAMKTKHPERRVRLQDIPLQSKRQPAPYRKAQEAYEPTEDYKAYCKMKAQAEKEGQSIPSLSYAFFLGVILTSLAVIGFVFRSSLYKIFIYSCSHLLTACIFILSMPIGIAMAILFALLLSLVCFSAISGKLAKNTGEA